MNHVARTITSLPFEVTLSLHRNDELGVDRAVIALVRDDASRSGLGGLRCLPYAEGGDNAAIGDAINLARGMHYKSAAAELPFAGAKSVISLKPGADRAAAMKWFAQLIIEFRKVITTYDVGVTDADIAAIASVAPSYVCGTSDGSGCPSPWTAKGVVSGILSAVRYTLHRDDVEGISVFVQGLGAVGSVVAEELYAAGAKLIVDDIDPAKVECFQSKHNVLIAADPLRVSADVFCPCALGGTVSFACAQRFRIVAGAANNQLVDDTVAGELHHAGVCYVPDWLINAGGLLSCVSQPMGKDERWVAAKVAAIGDRVAMLLDESSRTHRTPLAVAYSRAEAAIIARRGYMN